MLCSVSGYQCLREPGCFHLQGEVNCAGKKGIAVGLEYKGGGHSLADNRKWKRMVILVGGELAYPNIFLSLCRQMLG
jgi:hypothetical protein